MSPAVSGLRIKQCVMIRIAGLQAGEDVLLLRAVPVSSLGLDNDTVMGDREETGDLAKEENSSPERPSLLSQQLSKAELGKFDASGALSLHPEDKPAPLFAHKPRDADNLRPITLICMCRKVFEKLLLVHQFTHTGVHRYYF